MATRKALLVTDIVDSTLLAQRLDPDALSALWQAHDQAARELLGHWNGQEIDSSDGFLLMFDDASDALDYASAYHRALRTLPIALGARAGVHFGEVLLRTNEPADVRRGAKPVAVEGIAKPLAARVASLAQAGQTLVTADARAALTRRHAELRDRAWWRLKGVAEPVHLFEAVLADAAPVDLIDVEKAWRVVRRDGLWVPLREQPHNLARDRNAFVGRSAALDAVWQAFESGSRCVSLLGLGGVGKTRLAQRFGWARLGDFAGGVWFCDLAATRSPEDVCQAVADVLNVPLGRADAATRIASVLASRGRCLLILDNFEQVVGAAGATLGLWLDRAEDARFLVTSRDRLGIGGERGIVLQPLDRADAVALFEERAVAARGEPLRTDTDLAAVGPLVELLEGLPLAIELAAARATAMSVSEMLQRMTDRFALLVSSRSQRKGHSTLRAAFDWSWGLLSADEKAALAQLSVFEGSFSLPAAESVVRTSPAPALSVIDLVQRLVEQSLVRRGGDGRLDLLLSARDYAAEQLRAPGRLPGAEVGLAEATLDRHCRHFARLFAAEGVEFWSGRVGWTDWVARLRPDLGNGSAALRRALLRDDADSVLALGATLVRALPRSAQRERQFAAEQIERIALTGGRDELRLPALLAIVAQWMPTRSERARSASLVAVAAARAAAAHEDRSFWLFAALSQLVALAGVAGDRRTAAAALAEARALAEPGWPAQRMLLLADAEAALDVAQDPAITLRLARARYEIARRAGASEPVGLLNLAVAELVAGDALAARDRLVALLQSAGAASGTQVGAFASLSLVAALIELGELGQAARIGADAWAQATVFDLHGALADHLALSAALRGHLAEAALLVGYAGAAYVALADVRQGAEAMAHERTLEALAAMEERDRLMAQGARLSNRDAGSLAAASAGTAGVAGTAPAA
jgi:predicted ATPase/class 3 adenylate cyclase